MKSKILTFVNTNEKPDMLIRKSTSIEWKIHVIKIYLTWMAKRYVIKIYLIKSKIILTE